MNPKISDFGLARTFGGNQIEANTKKVVGTYGYMAPEYAGGGIFSIKSDVYSFGVLLLEIVCGEKNRTSAHKEQWNNLVGHAWELHSEGRSLQLVAKCLGESINASQVLRSIHVGLLCVQRHPEDRPTMSNVIMMLESEGPLPSPSEPGFYVGHTKQDNTQSSSSYGTSSSNVLSITTLSGR
ncbi:G-type lectin S-receptor-like serine/threonine-protein kinase SD1-1 [Bidens hawaiensis]|uniref:G-type lectin S-receptor-like serine/threonine-protein kinase SD1-1 n=1 Tax=Bidens hawaiensis TaxID=980011 RepID=UPI004048FADA